MSFFLGSIERKSSSLELFREIYGSRLAKTGAAINWQTAIRVATVLACARVKSQGLASVPFKVFRDVNGSKQVAYDHPLHYLLDTQPNPWQTGFEYRETIGLHLAMTGRHYSFINRLGGEIMELIPLEPGSVEPSRAAGGTITYKVTMDNGRSEDFPEEAIWHIRGESWNGWQGMDAMDLAREAVGLAISSEEQHAKLFKNGVSTTGTYSVEGTLSPTQYRDLRRFLSDNHSGENSGLPMIVDRGAKWLQQAMTGVDAQHLETRRHQVEEICRAMGVLPIAIGHADKTATFASAEAFFEAHDRLTMLPLYTRVEKSANAYLLGKKAIQQGYYTKHVVSGLLRASAKDRADYFSKALGSGGSPAWMTQDEVRELEERNPMGGDAAKLPVATNVPAAAPAPTP
jgi:HK97 family phage portal protein